MAQSTEGSEIPDASERESTELLSIETAIAKGQATYPELLFLKKECNKGTMLEVTPEKMHHVSGCGYVSVARILFNPEEPSSFTYNLQVLLTPIETGSTRSVYFGLQQDIRRCSIQVLPWIR